MYLHFPEKPKRDHKTKMMPRRSRWWVVLILIALNIFAAIYLLLLLLSPIIAATLEPIGCTFGAV